MLAASCTPERSASKRPRSGGGTVGWSCAATGPLARASRIADTDSVRAQWAARAAGLRVRAATETHADLEPPRRVEPRRIVEGDLVRGRVPRVVRAAGAGEHGAVEESRVEHVV